MIYYQGDDINFSIDIKQVSANDIADWTSFPTVVIYLYTHQSYIAKFNKTGNDGYGKLTLSSDYKTYSGKLTSEHTRNMRGALKMAIRVVDEWNDISTKIIDTGITIVPTLIKYEE